MKVYRQWLPCKRNSLYNFMPVFMQLCTSFFHGLKMCIWFGFNPAVNFCHFSILLTLSFFAGATSTSPKFDLYFVICAEALAWQNQQNDVCAQWRLRSACAVWSESSLCAQWVAKDPRVLRADSEDSEQTGRMPRLIWVFAGRTGHFVGFVMLRLNNGSHVPALNRTFSLRLKPLILGTLVDIGKTG